MHEIRINSGGSKAARYEELLPQISSLMEGEPDMTANLANVAAALKEAFGFYGQVSIWWGQPFQDRERSWFSALSRDRWHVQG